MPIDIEAEILDRQAALNLANDLAHFKASEAYVTAFRLAYNALVTESRDTDAARHDANEIAMQAYCNAHCVAFMNAIAKKLLEELARIQCDGHTPNRAESLRHHGKENSQSD